MDNRQNVKIPAQAQIDSGKPPRGWHFEMVSDGGISLVRNGHHLVELPEGITSQPGEYSWRAWHKLPTKAEMAADRAALDAERKAP